LHGTWLPGPAAFLLWGEAVEHTPSRSLRSHYPMTLHGLMDCHGIDPQVYLDTVHDLDIAAMLAPDPSLNVSSQ
jgi:hypothetical protein